MTVKHLRGIEGKMSSIAVSSWKGSINFNFLLAQLFLASFEMFHFISFRFYS